MALTGFQQYSKGLQANLSPARKTNPITDKYSNRMQEAYNSLPDQINAQSQAEQAAQEAESMGQEQQFGQPNPGRPAEQAQQGASTAGYRQEGINAPQSRENLISNESAVDPIAQIGKAETQNQMMQYMGQARQRAANSGNAGGFATGGADFSGSAIGGLDAEQSQMANAIANEGRRRGMGEADIQTAIMTSLAESGLRNLNYGDRDSVGLFQQRTSQGWGSVQQIMDPAYSAGKFYEGLSRVANRQNMNPWNAAQAVQRSFDPSGSNYQRQFARAQQITQQIVAAPRMAYNGSAEWINTHTNWYGDYDNRYAMQCVDLFNFYTSGFVGGNPMMGGVVGAKDIWTNHDRGAYVQLARSSRPQMGDVAVFGGSMGAGFGHVGIVAQYNPNGTVRVLNANATNAGPYGKTTMTNFATSALLGYLRPRKLMGV